MSLTIGILVGVGIAFVGCLWLPPLEGERDVRGAALFVGAILLGTAAGLAS